MQNNLSSHIQSPEFPVVSWLQRLLGRRPGPPLPIISADALGFTLTVRNRTRAVAWVAVRKIAGYKQDLGTHHQIVLLIEVLGLKHGVISLPEGCPGFAELFAPMEQALGINPRSYLETMTPAIKPSPTVLYLRSRDSTDDPEG